jgi:hypothetical protein
MEGLRGLLTRQVKTPAPDAVVRQRSSLLSIGGFTSRTTTALIVLLLILMPGGASRAEDAPPRGDLIEELMAYLNFDALWRDTLLAGEILYTGMPAMEPLPQAVAVAGAMLLIERPWRELLDIYLTDQTLRAYAEVQQFGDIPDRGGSADVLTDLRFIDSAPSELQALLKIRPGNKFNLSPDEIAAFNGIPRADTALADADALYRHVLWQRLTSYREAGLDGMAVYARRSGEAAPGVEMAAALESARFLQQRFPELHRALEQYPEPVPGIDESRLLWLNKRAGNRPLITLVHRLVAIEADSAVAAEREFYVGHSYNSMLTLVGVAPYGNGSVVFAGNRVFSEKVQGGGVKKSLGRKLVGKKLAERFERLRAVVDGTAPEPKG